MKKALLFLIFCSLSFHRANGMQNLKATITIEDRTYLFMGPLFKHDANQFALPFERAKITYKVVGGYKDSQQIDVQLFETSDNPEVSDCERCEKNFVTNLCPGQATFMPINIAGKPGKLILEVVQKK